MYFISNWNGIKIKATTKAIDTDYKFTIQTPEQTYRVVAMENKNYLPIIYRSELYHECLKTLFNSIKKSKKHFLGYNWYLLAKEYGVILPEARSWLKPVGQLRFKPISRKARVIGSIPNYLGNSLPKILNFSQPNLYEEWPDFEGYSWYDNLPKYQYEGMCINKEDLYVWFRNRKDNHLLQLDLPFLVIPEETVETHEIHIKTRVNLKLLIELLVINDKSERYKSRLVQLATKRAENLLC